MWYHGLRRPVTPSSVGLALGGSGARVAFLLAVCLFVLAAIALQFA